MDLVVLETGNGGDLQKAGNDFAVLQGWGNMPYLALFGGNIEGITKSKVPGELSKDWWGNSLLFPQDSKQQFNSLTERTLMEVALTSSGREKIQQAVEKDLEFMKEFAEIKVTVSIVSDDHIKIDIKVRQPKGFGGTDEQAKAYIFIWDATKQELGDYRFEDYSDDYFVG